MSKLILYPDSLEVRDNRDSLVFTLEDAVRFDPSVTILRKRRQRAYVLTILHPYMNFYNIDIVEWRGIPGQMPEIKDLEGMTR